MTRTTLAATVAIAFIAVSGAQAASDYDRAIERAAANMVAEKIGELRDGFEPGEEPRMTPAVDLNATGSVTRGWVDGLAPAADAPFAIPSTI